MTSYGRLNSNKSLHLLTILCPDCEVRWLAPGVRHGENYLCKECGTSFIVSKPNRRTSRQPAGIAEMKKTGSS